MARHALLLFCFVLFARIVILSEWWNAPQATTPVPAKIADQSHSN